MNEISTNTTIDGKVLKIKNLGGIIFFKILSQNEILQLICKKEYFGSINYDEIRKIRLNDFCRFSVSKHDGDLLILNAVIIANARSNCSWDEEKIRIVRAYSYILHLVRDYFFRNGYAEVRLPSIHYGNTKADAFGTEFFGQPARLTSSNALYLNLYAAQLGKAFSLQKCFRAEKSRTSRHLAEFDLLEVALMNEGIEKTIHIISDLIKYILQHFTASEFGFLSKVNIDGILTTGFPLIEYKELEQKYCIRKSGLGKYEKIIAKDTPVFVVNFPRRIASWIAKPLDDEYSISFNLLLPGVGEAVEGNEKQTSLQLLSRKFSYAKVEEQLRWYTEMMPYDNFLLSGFGLGIERLAMWIMGLKNIRHIHPIYRDMNFSENISPVLGGKNERINKYY